MKKLFMEGKKSPYFKEIKSAIKNLDKSIEDFLASDNELLNTAALHLHNSGGKRLRPGFIYLGGQFGDYDRDKLTPMAMAIEITHMATLVHDDVVDNAALRRGKPTVKSIWGNNVSVYAGNYLLAKALRLVSNYESDKINRTLADTALAMCRGEISQLRGKNILETDIDKYLLRIKGKTALLLAASCELGAYISGAEDHVVNALKNFGENLGMAFQITDDILDYSTEAEKFGKKLGGDIREGTMTLPLIYTASQERYRQQLQVIWNKDSKSEEDVLEVIKIVKEAKGIDYARSIAGNYIKKAQDSLEETPEGEAQKAFKDIAKNMLDRQI